MEKKFYKFPSLASCRSFGGFYYSVLLSQYDLDTTKQSAQWTNWPHSACHTLGLTRRGRQAECRGAASRRGRRSQSGQCAPARAPQPARPKQRFANGRSQPIVIFRQSPKTGIHTDSRAQRMARGRLRKNLEAGRRRKRIHSNKSTCLTVSSCRCRLLRYSPSGTRSSTPNSSAHEHETLACTLPWRVKNRAGQCSGRR